METSDNRVCLAIGGHLDQYTVGVRVITLKVSVVLNPENLETLAHLDRDLRIEGAQLDLEAMGTEDGEGEEQGELA